METVRNVFRIALVFLISVASAQNPSGSRNADASVTLQEFWEAHAEAAAKKERIFSREVVEKLFIAKDGNHDGILSGDEVSDSPVLKLESVKNEPYTPPEAIYQCQDIRFDPALPNVLLIGDSISIQYTPVVQRQLKGVANVARPFDGRRQRAVNCGSSVDGLKDLDRWLGTNRWDVIHFNWGLHDICYRNPAVTNLYGNRDKINGALSVPLDQYVANLDRLVGRMVQTGARLIWASTTVVPENEPGRHVGDELKYNRAALKIMEKYGVMTNDLHVLSSSFPAEYFSEAGDVHYARSGSEALGRQVAESICSQFRETYR